MAKKRDWNTNSFKIASNHIGKTAYQKNEMFAIKYLHLLKVCVTMTDFLNFMKNNQDHQSSKLI